MTAKMISYRALRIDCEVVNNRVLLRFETAGGLSSFWFSLKGEKKKTRHSTYALACPEAAQPPRLKAWLFRLSLRPLLLPSWKSAWIAFNENLMGFSHVYAGSLQVTDPAFAPLGLQVLDTPPCGTAATTATRAARMILKRIVDCRLPKKRNLYHGTRPVKASVKICVEFARDLSESLQSN